jgi:hypothetical protein
MPRRAGVYEWSALPAATRAKNPDTWGLSDLNPGDQAEAASRDACGIVDGNKVIIMAPAGDVGAAVEMVRVERELKGI